MTEKEQEEFKKILRQCLFNPDKPSKIQLRLKIIRAIRDELCKLSYEQLEEISCELNLLDNEEI